MNSLFDILIGKSLSGGSGGGGGGTSNYNALENKPQINGTTLTGNKSLSDLGIAAASDIPTVNNGTLTIQKNGTKIDEFKANQSANTIINITVPTTASDVSALPNTTKYAAALSLTINSSTYVVTGQLKDQNGDNLGSAQTIDLPLETMVVGGSYDDEHKKIVLTLKNGNTVDIPVADLVSGLQTELSATNKLDPAFIDYDSTHAAVTESEKTAWSGKQDALTFDGTYSSSTNKAATVSTVTNAINALDVTGETNIAASKTIKSWSETDGKVSVTTQDIAITGTQAVLTGYSEPSTASAVVATDTVNAAIGKVEKKADDNKTNILSVADQSTQYNLINLHDPIAVRYVVPTYLPEGGVTLDVNNATLTAFNISYPAIVGIKYKFVVRITATTGLSNFHVYIRDTDSEGTNVAEYPYGINNDTINSVGTHVFEFTATATTMWIGFYPNNSGTAVTGSVTMKAQVIEKSLYDAGFTDYQPYAMSNVELTANTQIIDITSGITAASGFTKSSTTHVYKQGKHIFGTLIFKKASGSYPTTGGDTVGTMGDYAPVAQWLGGGFFSDDMWKVQSYGYAFIQSANGQSDAGNIIVTDTTSSHNYVKIQIDYVMP